jgi:pimeloyl-ACP methyl ester carboxylesterase
VNGSVTSAQEIPIFFSAGSDTLFGILTRPETSSSDLAALILSGGGSTAPATNRNRLSVHLARRLASAGAHALRFDYHGVGESGGVLARAPRVDEPYVEDLAGAIRWVRSQQLERFVLIGACFGGRTALAWAPNDGGVRGLVLVSPPLRDLELGEEAATRMAQGVGIAEAFRRAFRLRTLRGFTHPARRRAYRLFARAKAHRALGRLRSMVGRRQDDRWISGRFLEPLKTLAARRVPVLFIYGTEDWHYHDFARASSGRLGDILESSPLTEVVVLDGALHGLTSVAMQQRVSRIIQNWVAGLMAQDEKALSPNGDGRVHSIGSQAEGGS